VLTFILGNRKCKYARFLANITGKMQIIKEYLFQFDVDLNKKEKKITFLDH
jgi:hypothetical protein